MNELTEQNKDEIISIRRTLVITGTRENLQKQRARDWVKQVERRSGTSGEPLVFVELNYTELPNIHESYHGKSYSVNESLTLWGRLKICWRYLLRNGDAR